MQPQRTLIFFVACKRKYFIISLLLLVFNLFNDSFIFFNCSCRWKPFLLWFSRLWYFATEGNYRGNSFLHFKELYVSTQLCIEYVCCINSFALYNGQSHSKKGCPKLMFLFESSHDRIYSTDSKVATTNFRK